MNLSESVQEMISQRKGGERTFQHSLLWKVGVATAITAMSLTWALNAMAGGTVADRVLGQPILTAGGVNFVGRHTIYAPNAVAVDHSVIPNRIYVADTRNNRVLGWKSAARFENGAPADILLGQPDFRHSGCNTGGFGPASLCRPGGVAVDSKGRLYVADTGNNRVLEYDAPFTGRKVARRVFGQNASFTTNDCNGGGVSTGSLCSPSGLAVDVKDRLYIADTGNNRVLEYDRPLSDSSASRVFGQNSSFTTNDCNGAGRNAGALCSPSAVASDSQDRLYVADTGNSRVLEYDHPLSDTNANRVFGQSGDMTKGDCDTAGLSGSSALCEPAGVTLDRVGHLYVSDTLNNRALEYDAPLKSATANRVFGQSGFTSYDCNGGGVSSRSLCNPQGLATTDSGSLLLADSRNNRVVEYDSPITENVASRVLGQTGFDLSAINLLGADGLDSPLGVAIDRSATPNRVYVADTGNNRVLGWRDARDFKNGAPANIVIGQPDFHHASCNSHGLNAKSLCGPAAVAVDGDGHLYVADSGNHRVLEYNSPFAANPAASRVYGQNGSFTTNVCDQGGVSANSLCMPSGVAVDRAGHLYVADTLNSRVLEYDSPLKTATATRAFGQEDGSLTSNSCNASGVPDAKSMCKPVGVAIDAGGTLYVADTGNSRVLEFAAPAAGTAPKRVFGQNGNFTTNDCNGGGVSALALCNPGGVAVDATGQLYVADTGNSRVVEYDHPKINTSATYVFGQQGSLDANGCNVNGLTAESLCNPNEIALDGGGDLYVADSGNNRVLKYKSPLSSPAHR
jgi:sugar lactone lactonase YvrE